MNDSEVLPESKAKNESKAWLYLILAGFHEVVWASGSRYYFLNNWFEARSLNKKTSLDWSGDVFL
jgi:hypothetical protein